MDMWIKTLYPSEYLHIGTAIAFQNPKQNFAEQQLSLDDLTSLSPHSMFLVGSYSNYPEAGIMQGSVLAIDRVLTPQHRHIIVAEVE
ncbi:hypothetical protein [Pantoea agglomerans]|jgi:DNA polymerase V|uniref:hypothetical protein n=1 Tax=Enterobacter agglomerans TaxID=549 RepID=UPI003FD050D6